MRTVQEIINLRNKKVLMRTDFDVPVSPEGRIQEIFRIEKQKGTLEFLTNRKARIALVAHIGGVDSFQPILSQLENILQRKVMFIRTIEELQRIEDMNESQVMLLDNIRRWPMEKENSPYFAQDLAKHFDLYINNAFAVSHRPHASVSAIAKFLPAYAGHVIQAEVEALTRVIEAPAQGKILIMGGGKTQIKVPVIKHLIDRAEAILIGGVLANDILKSKGFDVKKSRTDENLEQLLDGIDVNNPKIVLPMDFKWGEDQIFDVGPKTIELFASKISQAQMIIWNGPVGLFEHAEFAEGTQALGRIIAESKARKIIGGGDTIEALDNTKLLSKFDFVSTGGGAMLEFLAGNSMPGLEILK